MSHSDKLHHTLSQEDLELLRQRAQQLASSQEESRDEAMTLWSRDQIYLCFRLIDKSYGLPLSAIREAIALRSIVHLPGAPQHIVGLTRLRGQIITLVDLRRFWKKEAIGYVDNPLAIILDMNGVEFGIVCNGIEGLVELAPEEISEVPKNVSAPLADCLLGLARREIMLIDPTSLLEQPRFLVRQGSGGE